MIRQAFLNRIGGRFSRGVFWNALGTFFTQGSTFITAIVLARLLGKATFGELAMIQSTLLTLVSIAQVSTGLTATKYVAEFRDADKARAGRVLGMCSVLTLVTGLVATLLLLIGTPWISEHMFAAPQLGTSLALSSAFVLFSVMNAYQIGALVGLESYRKISVYGAILGVSHLAICSTGALYGGLNGALLGMVASAVLRWMAYVFVMRREAGKQNICIHLSGWADEQKILWRFALPAALAGLTTMPAIWVSNALLVNQANGYAEMGAYTAAMSFKALILIFPVLLNGVAISIINNHKGNGDNLALKSAVRINIIITSASSVCIGLLVWQFAHPLMSIFGSEFAAQGNEWLLLIVALIAVMDAIGSSFYQLVQSHGVMWVSFFMIALPRDILVVMSSYFLIPLYGGAGLASAMALGSLVALLTTVAVVSKIYNKLGSS